MFENASSICSSVTFGGVGAPLKLRYPHPIESLIITKFSRPVVRSQVVSVSSRRIAAARTSSEGWSNNRLFIG